MKISKSSWHWKLARKFNLINKDGYDLRWGPSGFTPLNSCMYTIILIKTFCITLCFIALAVLSIISIGDFLGWIVAMCVSQSVIVGSMWVILPTTFIFAVSSLMGIWCIVSCFIYLCTKLNILKYKQTSEIMQLYEATSNKICVKVELTE